MRCPTRKLTTACAILSLALLKTCGDDPVDSYCVVYNKVIVKKGDGSIMASPGVKKRILANELTYRSQCPQGT
jgi:hypothetical protein